MVSKRFSFVGRLTGDAPPGSTQVQQTTIFGFDFQHDYPRENSDTLTINSTDVSPFILQTAAVPAIRLLVMRVMSGQSITLKVTSTAGVDQAFNVSGFMVWEAPKLGDEISSVKINTNGVDVDIEYLAAGDTDFGVPPPPVSSSPGIAFDDAEQDATIDTSEGVTMEFAAAFSTIQGSFLNVEYRISGIMWVTGGTGTVRARRGGAVGAADGAIEASGTVTETVPTMKEFTAVVAKPSGTQLVKMTLEHPTGGEVLRARSRAIVINGV